MWKIFAYSLYGLVVLLMATNLWLVIKTKNGKLRTSLILLFASLLCAAAFRMILPSLISDLVATNIIVVAFPVVAMLYTSYVFFTYSKGEQ